MVTAYHNKSTIHNSIHMTAEMHIFWMKRSKQNHANLSAIHRHDFYQNISHSQLMASFLTTLLSKIASKALCTTALKCQHRYSGPQVPTFVQRRGISHRHHNDTTLHFEMYCGVTVRKVVWCGVVVVSL